LVFVAEGEVQQVCLLELYLFYAAVLLELLVVGAHIRARGRLNYRQHYLTGLVKMHKLQLGRRIDIHLPHLHQSAVLHPILVHVVFSGRQIEPPLALAGQHTVLLIFARRGETNY
jgi:hypothetical protein